MLKKNSSPKILVIVFLVTVALIAVISYGLITRCDNVAIYKYCGAEEFHSGR